MALDSIKASCVVSNNSYHETVNEQQGHNGVLGKYLYRQQGDVTQGTFYSSSVPMVQLGNYIRTTEVTQMVKYYLNKYNHR